MNKKDRKLYNELMSEVSDIVTEALDRAFPESNENESKTFLDLFVEQFDINSIPYESRKKQYVDYDIYYGLNVCSETIEPLYPVDEGLLVNPKDIHPAKDLDELMEFLYQSYKIADWQVQMEDKYGVLKPVVRTKRYLPDEFGFIIPDIHENIHYIEHELKEYGYYLFDTKEFVDNAGMKWIIANFDPLIQPSCKDYLKSNDIRTLIHCSPTSNRDSIMANGFQPRYEHTEAYYPPKLFFIISGRLSKKYIGMLNKSLKRHNCKTMDVYIFKIKDLVDKFTFYRDPNVSKCCYTKDTIPYKYVSKVIYDVIPDNYDEYDYDL